LGGGGGGSRRVGAWRGRWAWPLTRGGGGCKPCVVQRCRVVRFGSWLLACWMLAGWSGAAEAKPPKRDPPLLFGGAVTKPKVKAPLDPRLPTGADLPASTPRPAVTASLCSFVRPVCVHATTAAARAVLPEALAAF